jgi:hypothetical protein
MTDFSESSCKNIPMSLHIMMMLSGDVWLGQWMDYSTPIAKTICASNPV